MIQFDDAVILKIAEFCDGYPYLAQLMGKACVSVGNEWLSNTTMKKKLVAEKGTLQ